jgi:peptidoglycan/xylan/chitin deacetylase (PgdA/CDA1 family)
LITLRNRVFYIVKPVVPRPVQLYARRRLARWIRPFVGNQWPIDEAAGVPPAGWPGWPEKKKFALVLMHDVDNQRGHDRVRSLMAIEEEYGFRSSFNFVPERYRVSESLRSEVQHRGFEVGVHGLKHDGKLFASRTLFDESAPKIRAYMRDWRAEGFSAPSMLRNLEWADELGMVYEVSTFDTDPFEPEPFGVRTIFPYWVDGRSNTGGHIELPYTLAQDFTLFMILGEQSIDVWKQKLDWIAERGGLALLNTHPDYMQFDGQRKGPEEYPLERYRSFLSYAAQNHSNAMWHALPIDAAKYWKRVMVAGRAESGTQPR